MKLSEARDNLLHTSAQSCLLRFLQNRDRKRTYVHRYYYNRAFRMYVTQIAMSESLLNVHRIGLWFLVASQVCSGGVYDESLCSFEQKKSSPFPSFLSALVSILQLGLNGIQSVRGKNFLFSFFFFIP